MPDRKFLLRSINPATMRRYWEIFFATVILLIAVATAQKTTQSRQAGAEVKPKSAPATSGQNPELVQKGSALFRQNCSFCHGRDATGGETGPDLTRSKLVGQDVDGDKIGAVIRSGRPDKGMPRFDRSDEQ